MMKSIIHNIQPSTHATPRTAPDALRARARAPRRGLAASANPIGVTLPKAKQNIVMTSDSTAGHVTSASTVLAAGKEAWRSSDEVKTTRWESAASAYQNTTGNYVLSQNTVLNTGNYAGEWWQCEFPEARSVAAYRLSAYQGLAGHPDDWKIASSDNGTTWIERDSRASSGSLIGGSLATSTIITMASGAITAKYWRFIINRCEINANWQSVRFHEFEYLDDKPRPNGRKFTVIKTDNSTNAVTVRTNLDGLLLDGSLTGVVNITKPGSSVDILVSQAGFHSTALYVNESGPSLAMGFDAGAISQGSQATAIGNYAGNDTQGINSVAVGYYAGHEKQGENAVSVGIRSGELDQGLRGVAIGDRAGQTGQGKDCIAIGYSAGQTSQAENAIAIGRYAGSTGQATNSICIGAASVATHANCICLGTGATSDEDGQFVLAGLAAVDTGTTHTQTNRMKIRYNAVDYWIALDAV